MGVGAPPGENPGSATVLHSKRKVEKKLAICFHHFRLAEADAYGNLSRLPLIILVIPFMVISDLPVKLYIAGPGHQLACNMGLSPVFIITGRNEVVAKVMFLLVSVILFIGGSASVHAGIPPPAPEGSTPTGIRSMSGRYASYWNAFLLSF